MPCNASGRRLSFLGIVWEGFTREGGKRIHQVKAPDWTCPQCGTNETWQIVKLEHPDESHPGTPIRDLPTLDWTCASCGTTETWQIVKVEPRSEVKA